MEKKSSSPQQDPEKPLSRKERKEQALDRMFGKDRKEYIGNMWGWPFSILSLVGLSLVALFMMIGVWTGNIDLTKQQQLETRPGELLKQTRLEKPKVDKDTLN